MKRIAILTGGTSSEREIALQSAMFITTVLERDHLVSVFIFPEQLGDFLENYREIDVVIPVFHGVGGEDGTIQGLLETLGHTSTCEYRCASSYAVGFYA